MVRMNPRADHGNKSGSFLVELIPCEPGVAYSVVIVTSLRRSKKSLALEVELCAVLNPRSS